MKEKVLIVEDQFIEADYLRQMLMSNNYHVCTLATSVTQAQEVLEKEKPSFALLDIFVKGKATGIDFASVLQKGHIPFVYLSANSSEEILAMAKKTQPYGFLVKPFREKDLLVTMEIARYRHEHSIASDTTKDATLRQHLRTIFERPVSLHTQLELVPPVTQPFIPFDFITIESTDGEEHAHRVLRMFRVGYDEYQVIGEQELKTISGNKGLAINSVREDPDGVKGPVIYAGDHFGHVINSSTVRKLYALTFDLRSCLSLTVTVANRRLEISHYSKRPNAYTEEHLRLARSLRESFESGMALSMLHSKQVTGTADTPVAAVTQTETFEGIVGRSSLMLNVFDHVKMVAASDTSVLILGESGTGKERIADCIHKMSPRHREAFVKVNCAALPASIIESELFGHEKGAFTGAHEKRIGKFEQANKGTIFLDEIGELPIEFQAKLLRVIQEKVVERLGSNGPTKIDVRIIAATNRNLEKEVAEGRFRLDLYYRLNVFPIGLPSLQERKEDIPELVAHFLKMYNVKTGKKLQGFSLAAMAKLMDYAWPGNIRELENVVERNVLLAKTSVIDDILFLRTTPVTVSMPAKVDNYVKSIDENERDHIIAVLQKCNGKIWGPGAAAELLQIPPSTLKSKMKKLGIEKRFA